MLRAFFRSRRGGVVALATALALSGACGRSELLPGDVEGSDGGRGDAAGGGRGGRGFGGTAGSRPIGGAGAGGAAGNAGAPAGAAGVGGQPPQSQYCGVGERAVLYLLAEDEVILRVDADTLETLTRVNVDPPTPLFSLAATDNGVVFATSEFDLDLYRIDQISGQGTPVNLLDSIFGSNGALSVGFSPADPVLFGDTLLLAQVVLGEGVDLYALPVTGGAPLWRHQFKGMTEAPELALAPDGRTFALHSESLFEYDPGILSELGRLPMPGPLEVPSGDVAYLSGYLFTVHAVNQSLSWLHRVQVMSDFEDSPIEELQPLADFIIGIGAACEALP